MENTCNLCGHNNEEDNFICVCEFPLDLSIETNDLGLPEIIQL